MSMISFSSSCLVVQTLLLEDFSVIMIVVIVDLLIVKGLENLSHDFIVEFDRLLKFGDALHQLHKEHWLSVLLALFSNKNGITHKL